jgi:hypothetical protein
MVDPNQAGPPSFAQSVAQGISSPEGNADSSVPSLAAPAQARVTPQASPQAPAQPSVTTPPVPPSPNQRLHSFVSSVLSGISSSMAGRAPVKYTTDESGKVIADPNQPVDSRKAQFMRIGATALAGLGAGARAGGQKSGLANALSGLGAGAENQMKNSQEQDANAKKEARENQEASEQMKLHKMELAKGAALLQSTYQHMHEQDVDRNEDYKSGAALAQSAEDSGVSVQRVNGDKLMTMYRESPEQLLTEGKIVPVGETTVNNPETGQPYLDPDTHAPKYERQYAVIDGMHSGTLKVPAATVAYIKKYAPYSKDYAGITGLDGLSDDHEMDMKQLAVLHNAAVDGRKQVLIGEEKPATMIDPKTKQPILVNSVTKEPLKNADGSYMTPNAKNEVAESAGTVAKDKAEIPKLAAETNRDNAEADKARQDTRQQNDLNPKSAAGLQGEQYLATLKPEDQSVLKAIAEGRNHATLQNRKGELTPIGQSLMRAYPDYDIEKAKAYGGVVKDFTTGASSKALTAYGTAINHARALYDNTGTKSYIPGTDEYKRYNQDITYVATEVAKALNPTGVATETSIKEQEAALRSVTNRKAAIENAEHILTGKMAEMKQRWANGQVRPSYQPPMPTISQEALDNADYIRNHGKMPAKQNQQRPATGQPQPVGHKVGDSIVQNGKTFTVTNVDANGKVTGAQ